MTPIGASHPAGPVRQHLLSVSSLPLLLLKEAVAVCQLRATVRTMADLMVRQSNTQAAPALPVPSSAQPWEA